MANGTKNVLVTGGAGFIGSHVVDTLIDNGYTVRVLDNLAPPTHNGKLPEWFNKKAEFLKGDVRIKKDWRKALNGVEAVIHLAAYMDQHPDFSNYVSTNVESIALMFESVVENKIPIKKIIAASSQSVYGHGKYRCKNHGSIYPEPRTINDLKNRRWDYICKDCGETLTFLPEKEDDTLFPQIPYGISKLASEQLLMNLAKNNEPIKINEDGQQSRDFVDVRDTASAYLKVLEDSRADFQIFNFGSGNNTKIIDLAEMVSNAAEVPFWPSLNNRFRAGDARHSPMDMDKLKALGWRPKYALAEAVSEYLKWVRQFKNLKENLDKNYDQLKKEGILFGY